MSIIEVDQVTKEFSLGQLVGLGQSIKQVANRIIGRRVTELAPFKALDNVTFSVDSGEVLGIIGHNGAGKSTLLKLLAGIIKPTRGRINVHGRVAPLIEVGAGLVPDMTGRENVFLNASILGMKKAEIKRKFDEIVAFAEIEKFIDTPVKRYSSGMQIRLGFSIATSIDSEILIVDEVLAVGDLAFQRKCFDRMEELIHRQRKTVILVSHNIRQVERLCSRVMHFSAGKKIRDADPEAVCRAFYETTNETVIGYHSNAIDHANNNEWATGDVKLLSIVASSPDSERDGAVMQFGDLTIGIRVETNHSLNLVTFGIGLHTSDFVYLATDHSHLTHNIEELPAGEHYIECRFKSIPFAPGSYSVRLGIAAGKATGTVLYSENLAMITVLASPRYSQNWQEGMVSLDTEWKMPVGAQTRHEQQNGREVGALEE